MDFPDPMSIVINWKHF